MNRRQFLSRVASSVCGVTVAAAVAGQAQAFTVTPRHLTRQQRREFKVAWEKLNHGPVLIIDDPMVMSGSPPTKAEIERAKEYLRTTISQRGFVPKNGNPCGPARLHNDDSRR